MSAAVGYSSRDSDLLRKLTSGPYKAHIRIRLRLRHSICFCVLFGRLQNGP